MKSVAFRLLWLLAQEDPLLLDQGGEIGPVAFSRDGRDLAYVWNGELRTISVDGKTKRTLRKPDPRAQITEIYGWDSEGGRILCKVGDFDLIGVASKGGEIGRWTPSKRWRFIDWTDGDAFLIYDTIGAWTHWRMKWDGGREKPDYDRYPTPYVLYSRDGKTAYFARWKGESLSDRRFRIMRSEPAGSGEHEIAVLDTGCFTDYVLLRLSADESLLYASTQGTAGMMSNDVRDFGMVLSMDGALRRSLRLISWVHGSGRALVRGKDGGVDILDVVRGTRTTWEAVRTDRVAVAPDLTRAAVVVDRKLRIRSIP